MIYVERCSDSNRIVLQQKPLIYFFLFVYLFHKEYSQVIPPSHHHNKKERGPKPFRNLYPFSFWGRMNYLIKRLTINLISSRKLILGKVCTLCPHGYFYVSVINAFGSECLLLSCHFFVIKIWLMGEVNSEVPLF